MPKNKRYARTPRYTPEYLKLWTRPDSYWGATWEGYYGSGFGQSRDSDALERANFKAVWNALTGESETAQIVRESHWAVGWVEWISIHKDDAKGLRIADKLREGYEDYPIVDEELFSEIEDEDCSQCWENCYNPKERLEYLRRHLERHHTPFRDIMAAVRGSWDHAANILPCPSDILH